MPVQTLFRPQRGPFLLRLLVIVAWAAIFIAIPRLPIAPYLVPCLALITFFLLSPFPLILAALFLTAYVTGFQAEWFSDQSMLASTLLVWLAALIALTVTEASRRRIENRERAPAPVSVPDLSADLHVVEPEPSSPPTDGTSSNLRHDLRTPINMIAGFCEALLRPYSPFRTPLPAPYRADVEAILRNIQQLEHLINRVLDSQPPADSIRRDHDAAATSVRKTLILLDDSGAALQMFSQYTKRFNVVHVANVEALGRLKSESDPVAIVISSDDNPPVPTVAALAGQRIPILTFNLGGEPSTITGRAAREFLMKPVEIDALAAALQVGGTSLRSVLIVDDNRDSAQMLSRMLSALAPSAQIWKAYSGREALALLHEERPDAILLDIVLPDMDGMAMLDYLSADIRFAQVPIIVVSAHRLPDIAPVPGVSKLTLFRMAGFTPAQIVQYIEALFTEPDLHP